MTPFLWMFPVPRAWPGLTGCRGFRDAECGGRTGTCLFRWLAVTGMGRAPPSHGRRKAAGAAMTLERSMTGVSLTASRENEGASATRLHTPLDGLLRCSGWNRNTPARVFA